MWLAAAWLGRIVVFFCLVRPSSPVLSREPCRSDAYSLSGRRVLLDYVDAVAITLRSLCDVSDIGQRPRRSVSQSPSCGGSLRRLRTRRPTPRTLMRLLLRAAPCVSLAALTVAIRGLRGGAPASSDACEAAHRDLVRGGVLMLSIVGDAIHLTRGLVYLSENATGRSRETERRLVPQADVR